MFKPNMGLAYQIIIFYSLASWLAVAQSRPVSYPTGWTMMLQNNDTRRTMHAHYSPTAKWSVGYKFEDWQINRVNLHALQVNYLFKRWNQRESQANLYWKNGLGVSDLYGRAAKQSKQSSQALAGFSSLAFDWETRRYFTAYEIRYTDADNFTGFYQQAARLGLAPYLGQYGDLHTWIMLEASRDNIDQKTSDADDNDINHWTLTPLLRLFKGPQLVELGISGEGDVLFNYFVRF